MRTTELTLQQLVQRSFNALLAGGVIAMLGAAVPAHATLFPQPVVCISDNNGVPIVSTIGIDEIDVGTPVTTPGDESVNFQFYTTSVFLATSLTPSGPLAVFLTAAGVTNQIITFDVAQTGPDQNSVNIFFADNTYSNFNSLLTTYAGSPAVAETGSELNVSPELNLANIESLQICTDCSVSAPETASTLALLVLGLGGVVVAHRAVLRVNRRSR